VTKKLLLFAATTGYQIRVFEDTARKLGIDLTLATDRCHVMEDPWGDRAIAVKFDDCAASLAALQGREFDGVAAVGDRPAILAAEIAEALGLPFHPADAARACSDKAKARALYRAGGLPVPVSQVFDLPSCDWDVFPCVIKPLGSSASRGVIRANDTAELKAAAVRLHRMGEERAQIEAYIPGREFAIEGLVTDGRFEAVAIFDKPDPLEGPYFEETIYTTPSREPEEVQAALLKTAAAAVKAIGLWHGPAHLELRYNDHGAWILETHARPIGGLCARTLPAWEETILRHAVGELNAAPKLDGAAGVMMIPIPHGGIYQSVDGVERAREVRDIEDIVITAVPGQRLVTLPEGSSYLGFIFARAVSPGEAEVALRRAHARLEFSISRELDVLNS
jgi:glutathione synthase/RimK-type ligase-like ATP-grasp enzyme